MQQLISQFDSHDLRKTHRVSGLAQSVFEMEAARKLPNSVELQPAEGAPAKAPVDLSALYFDLEDDL